MPESLIYTRRRAYKSPTGFEHPQSKAVLQMLGAYQATYFREVEGITIFSLQRKYLCSSLAIRFKERFLCFSLTLISFLRWHSAKAIDVNE